MTTHIETSTTVNIPADKVLAALGTKEYWEYETANIADEPGEVAEFSSDPINVVLFEVLSATALPEAVRSMVSQDLKLKRTISFGALEDGTATGEMFSEIKGAPVKFEAELTLIGEGDSTTFEAEVDIDVTIPMIGPVIEPKVADYVRDIVVNEASLVEKWITENN
ncbi:MAG: DUF2505 domain-containing protein [Mycobacteriaceae bacterium]|uniref:DUF2505 domain-containing protein n=1 Tax=Corynebacterium sp. TaxID=1720 RepID=UPI003F97C762